MIAGGVVALGIPTWIGLDVRRLGWTGNPVADRPWKWVARYFAPWRFSELVLRRYPRERETVPRRAVGSPRV